MKKLTAFITALCCISFLLTAQKIQIGLNGGISIPNLQSHGDNEISKGYASRLAATFGGFADFAITKKISLKAFINYAGQGGKRTGMQPVTDVPSELSQLLPPGTVLYADFINEAVLNYLEIPLMAKIKWGDKLEYYLNAGPYIGFLVSARQKTSGSSQFFLDKEGTMPLSVMGQPLPAQSFDANTDVKKDIHSANFGITGGGGLGYSLNKTSEILLDVRGAYGFTDIQKDTEADGKSHTGGLFITLGYAYTIR